MADKCYDAIDLAFAKIEAKGKKTKNRKEEFKQKKSQLQVCQSEDEISVVSSQLLDVRSRTKFTKTTTCLPSMLPQDGGTRQKAAEEYLVKIAKDEEMEEAMETWASYDSNEEVVLFILWCSMMGQGPRATDLKAGWARLKFRGPRFLTFLQQL